MCCVAASVEGARSSAGEAVAGILFHTVVKGAVELLQSRVMLPSDAAWLSARRRPLQCRCSEVK